MVRLYLAISNRLESVMNWLLILVAAVVIYGGLCSMIVLGTRGILRSIRRGEY